MLPVLFDKAISARLLRRTLLAIVLLFWLFPLLAVAWFSVRSPEDLAQGNYWNWPHHFAAWENYAAVLSSPRFLSFMANSLIISISSAAGAIALAAMAGFSLARYSFPGNLVLLAIFIGGNLMPFQSLMIPVRDVIVGLGIYDTKLGLILFHVAFQTGFCTLFIRNAFKKVPDSLIDAARVDGATEFQILIHIALPLLRPVLAGLAALVFTFVWNDFFWALVLAHSDHARPLTAGLQSLRGMWLTQWQLMAAASLVAVIPPVLLFFLLQRQFVGALYRSEAPTSLETDRPSSRVYV
jgi:multiple sugar transport system permease protein